MAAAHLCCFSLLFAAAILADDANFRGETPWAKNLVAGRVALDTGNYTRAILAYKQALLTIPQTGRENLLERALAADGLGVAYARFGRYAQAEVNYRYALAIWTSSSGDKTATVAIALSNLGTLCFYRGGLRDARGYYAEALSIDRGIFGPESAAVARDLNNLAAVEIEERKFSGAERLLRRAIEIGRAVASRDSRLTTSMRNLAVLLARLRRFRDARTLHEETLKIQRTEDGPAHPNVGITLSELAYSELGLKNCGAAESHARESLEILRAALGEQHDRTATAYRALGLAYRCKQRPDLAEPALLHVIQIDQDVEQRDILRIEHLREYAAVLRALGRKSEAKKFEASAAAIRAGRQTTPRHTVDLKELQTKQ